MDTSFRVRRPQRWDQPYNGGLDAESLAEVRQFAPFADLDPNNFPSTHRLEDILCKDGGVRHLEYGDVVTHLGDYGSTCYLVLDGKLKVVLDDPQGLVDVRHRKLKRKAWWKLLLQPWINSTVAEARDVKSYEIQTQVRDDGSGRVVDTLKDPRRVSRECRTADLVAGDFLGEVAALTRTPRTATIYSAGETRVYELRWQGLRDLRRFDPGFAAFLSRLIGTRSFLPLLRANPLLAELPEAKLESVAKYLSFESFGSSSWYKELVDEDPIVSQGDHLDGLLLIRGGFVRVTRNFGNGERTVGYLAANELFGMTELLDYFRRPGRLTSRYTLRPVGYVDVLRLPTDVALKLLLPELESAGLLAKKDLVRRAAPISDPLLRDPLPAPLLDEVIDRRIINGTSTMVIDTNRCVGCDDCVNACSVAHNGNPRFVRHGVQSANLMFVNACMHCRDPVCLIDCPTGAIQRVSESSTVVINDRACVGCGNCARSCPYDNIRMVEIRGRKGQPILDLEHERPVRKATKCDLCVDQWGGPACERACPHDALKRLDMADRDGFVDWLTR